jgi:hypothetical protein
VYSSTSCRAYSSGVRETQRTTTGDKDLTQELEDRLVAIAASADQGVQIDRIDETNALVTGGGGEVVQMSAEGCGSRAERFVRRRGKWIVGVSE